MTFRDTDASSPYAMVIGYHQARGESIPRPIHPSGTVDTGLGRYRYQSYRLAAAGQNRGVYCTAFKVLFDPAPLGSGFRRMVWGQSCDAQPFSDAEIAASLRRIGVRGPYDPAAGS